MMDEGHVKDGFSNQTELPQKDPRAPTIDTRCDGLAERMDVAHKALTELEARISPVLHQEPPAEVRAVPYNTASDDSAVIVQKLSSIELRLIDLIDRIHGLAQRSEVQ